MQSKFAEKVCLLFDHFYNKIYRSNFKLDLSINNQYKIVDSFEKLLYSYLNIVPGTNINILISYFSFAFSCYAKQTLKRNIALNWIIGKKMFKRFFERKDETDYYVQQFLKEYNINLDQVRSMLVDESEERHVELHPSEEIEKRRFYGEARLYNCLVNTTMYNHRSVNCLTCEQKTSCKRLLKETYPKIYIKRGYEK